MWFRQAITLIKPQIFLLFFLLLIQFCIEVNLLPTIPEIEQYLSSLVQSRNSFIVIFFLSILENLIGFGAYFPGSLVILIAMTTTYGYPDIAFFMFLSIYVGALTSYNLNFFLGRKCRVEQNVIGRSKKNVFLSFFFSFWHPNFSALASFKAGSDIMSYKFFLSNMFISSFIWNVFWAVTMYFFGSSLNLGAGNLLFFVYIYIFLWIVYDLYGMKPSNKK